MNARYTRVHVAGSGWFVSQFTTLSVPKALYRRMVGRQVNNKFEKTWKEEAVD
jgi:hypothetical protein